MIATNQCHAKSSEFFIFQLETPFCGDNYPKTKKRTPTFCFALNLFIMEFTNNILLSHHFK